MWRNLILVLIAALAAENCGSSSKSSPTAPSPAPPAPTAPIRYTAVGASDAIGVGGTVVCVPFTPCDNGTGYVQVLTRRLRTSREVTLVNLGIPAAVLSPTIFDIARRNGRDVPANFVDQEMPFVPAESTLVTVFGGGNDANALADAIERGAAGSDVRGYIDTQVRAYGSDFDRLTRGIRSRAPGAFVIVLNLPNLAGLPYALNMTQVRRQRLQAIAVGFSREANRQAGPGVVVVDLMCDPGAYDPTRFSSDGFHPNDSGYNYLADKLFPVVGGGSSTPLSSCSQMSIVPQLPL